MAREQLTIRGTAVISAAEPEKQTIEINGKRMAYVEMGEGDPIVFQHGNPTSSYLWRNVMPHVADQGRCIAVDLIGMGDSEKLDKSGPDRYRYVEHRDYLFDAWEAHWASRDRVTLVIHDWGSALGFDWAFGNTQDAVLGIAYMEAIVKTGNLGRIGPRPQAQVFQGFRSRGRRIDGTGEERVRRARVAGVGYSARLSKDDEMNGLPSGPLRDARRGPPPYPDLAATDPDRGRTGGRSRAIVADYSADWLAENETCRNSSSMRNRARS